MEKIVKDQKEYSKDNRMIEVYYKEDEYKRLYDTKEEVEEAREQGIQQGIQQGLEQGLQQGKAEEKLETAKKLKAAGIALDTIAECTGLDIETVKSL